MKLFLTATVISSLATSSLVAQAATTTDGPPRPTSEPTTPAQPEKWQPGHTLDFNDLPTDWIQGTAPTQFEQDTVYLIDLWKAPLKGARSYKFHRRKPGFCAYEILERFDRLGTRPDNVKLLTIAVNEPSSTERLQKFLALPALQCDHPVANDGPAGTIYSKWLAPLGFRSFPHTIIVKNGKLLWSGDGTAIPEDLIQAASRPDFDLDAHLASRQQSAELFRSFRSTTDSIWQAAESGASLDQLHSLIDKQEERCGHDPFMFMQLQELRFSLCLDHKDPAGAVAAMAKAAHTFPSNTFIQGRVFKYLYGKEDLKPASYPIIIHCMERQALLRDSEYGSLCWIVIGETYAEMNEMEKATAAFEKAVSLSTAQARLETLQAGKPLPIAE